MQYLMKDFDKLSAALRPASEIWAHNTECIDPYGFWGH